MANVSFNRSAASNPALIPQYWAQRTFRDSFSYNPLKRFMGKGQKAIIQVNMDLKKVKGDRVTFNIRDLLTDAGQSDDGTYEGNEEAMSYKAFPVVIHEHGHSTQLAGTMTEKSAAMNLRRDAKDALAEWQGRMDARFMIDALSGLLGHKFTGKVLGNSALALDASSVQIPVVTQVAPTRSATAARYFCGGQTSSGVLARVANVASLATASHRFGTKVIEYCKRMATNEFNKTTGAHITPIRPIYIDGKPFYVMLYDKLQKKSIRVDADWKAAMQNAYIMGKSNPLFSGADAIWDGVALFETELLHQRLGAGGILHGEYFDITGEAVASGVTAIRSLFLGAQALCVAYGKSSVWTEGHVDWQKTKWGFHTRKIHGMKKVAKFSTAATPVLTADSEFGCIICDTAVVVD